MRKFKVLASMLCMCIMLSAPLTSFAASSVQVDTSVVFSAEIIGPGGRHDIPLGYHNVTKNIYIRFTRETWVAYFNADGSEVWAGSFGVGEHKLICNSNVYKVTIYLADNEYAILEGIL